MKADSPTRSRVQQVRDQLEDDIVNGRMRPGEQVQIEQLMARFGVSRTPVREALQQLEISGLVAVQPKRGTFVAQVGMPELIQMFEVMAELEAMCARLATRRVSQAALRDIEIALVACEAQCATQDSNAYYYANEQFHQLIYQACGNAFLVQQTQLLKNRLKPYRRLQLQLRNRMSQSLQEHRDIVRALQQGEEEAAAQAARDHVLIQGQRFTDLMSLASQPLAPPARTLRIEPLQRLGA
ncbi:GntR family transcriptional regulator [Hydrogenophaga sp.]|uniref:GntR family transcriptional regulator n=1 Tax=Hydrogenophaga sp. TaxID=1904254 RepID=UPI0025C2CC6B|nr:GntR family transcriptional regulator [Hydrogenophaga sp.]